MSLSKSTHADIAKAIIALETEALERWNHGDPGGYLDISDEDVTYFDPFTEERLNGRETLRQYYEPIIGQIHVSKYEMPNPMVIATSHMAVLTFNLHSYQGAEVHKWNCTEVYRLDHKDQWKIVQTHWSKVKLASV